MLIENICIITLIISFIYIGHIIFKRLVLPKLIEIGTKEIEKNPDWIMSKTPSEHYGFYDIDIITAESTNMFGVLPRFRLAKNNRYELWISNDMTTKDIEEIAQLALMGKIQVKYGLFYPDKSIHWLSLLCFMLDGGDIKKVLEDTTKQVLKDSGYKKY